MSDGTNYIEGLIRDWMSQGSAMPSPPDPIHVALHTSDPGESPDGPTEVGAADYSRASTSAGTDWNTPNENDFTNASDIGFGVATSDWGIITHVSMWDGPSASDNCLAAYALDENETIGTDDEFIFRAGQLSFSID